MLTLPQIILACIGGGIIFYSFISIPKEVLRLLTVAIPLTGCSYLFISLILM